jgi:hypothetical protein
MTSAPIELTTWSAPWILTQLRLFCQTLLESEERFAMKRKRFTEEQIALDPPPSRIRHPGLGSYPQDGGHRADFLPMEEGIPEKSKINVYNSGNIIPITNILTT